MSEFWQNQRHYGVFGWNPPAPFERKEWTDVHGSTLTPPKNFPTEDWLPVVDDSTDGDGWVYSTAFDHIERGREGGRACKRSTDRVRRRKWIPRRESEMMQNAEHTRIQPTVDVQRGVQQFMMLLAEVTARRKMWDFLPWDPVAWLIIHAEHQEYLNSFQSLQMELRECLTDEMDESAVELLDDLAMGASISRAAYGYAMAAGHLDTIEAFFTMHAFHSQYFNPVAGASIDANLEAVMKFTGLRKKDIVMSDWTNREYQPCHFIAQDASHKRIILAIRGSMEMGDLITDISGGSLQVEFNGVAGTVHEGSMASAIYIQCKTAPILLELFHEHPDWSLFITGHSIGGGVAALLSMIFRFEKILPLQAHQMRCIAVGSAAVMSENLAELCREFVTSFVFRSDVVPRLSCFSIESLMIELVKASPMKKTVDSFLETASNAFQNLKNRLPSFSFQKQQKTMIDDLHLIPVLAADPDAVAGALHAVSEISTSTPLSQSPRAPRGTFSPLYPPGRVLWLLGGGSMKPPESKRDQRWWEQIQLWSQRNLFRKEQSNKRKRAENKVAEDCSWVDQWMKDHFPQEGKQTSLQAQEEAPDVVLIEIERKNFSRLLVLPNMIQDHLPNSYFISITKLKEQFDKKRSCNLFSS